MAKLDPFDKAGPDYVSPDRPQQLSLFLSIEGYEGPIDVLLSLAREQKVDLTQISILELAEQYITFIREARALNLEIAADYLVMAAWLAYLKSRLLLPPEEGEDDEPTGEELAEILRFQLQRLQAMQAAGSHLMAGARLGIDRFPRGEPEALAGAVRPVFDLTLFELLRAYGDQKVRSEHQVLRIAPTELFAVEEAVQRLRRMLGNVPSWRSLFSFLPTGLRGGLFSRSAMASTLVASLELAKDGALELRQDDPFGPIYLRTRGSQS